MDGIGSLVGWTFTMSLASFRFRLFCTAFVAGFGFGTLLCVFPVGSFGIRIGNSGSWFGASRYFPHHLNQLSSE